MTLRYNSCCVFLVSIAFISSLVMCPYVSSIANHCCITDEGFLVECRPLPNSTSTVTAKPVSTMSETSRNKKKLSHGVQQDLRGDDAEDENVEMRACGFPLHLGRWTLQHFRYSFWTSRSNSRSPCQATKMDYTKQGNESDNSEDVFWSDEVRLTQNKLWKFCCYFVPHTFEIRFILTPPPPAPPKPNSISP